MIPFSFFIRPVITSYFYNGNSHTPTGQKNVNAECSGVCAIHYLSHFHMQVPLLRTPPHSLQTDFQTDLVISRSSTFLFNLFNFL